MSLFFQREGDLQRQVKETMRALRELGIHARLAKPKPDRRADFDGIRASEMDGNFENIVWGKRLGAPVVLSPAVDLGCNKRKKMRAEVVKFLTERLTSPHTLRATQSSQATRGPSRDPQ